MEIAQFTISQIKKIINDEKPDKVIVAFSGGKDSTTLLHLLIQSLIEIKKRSGFIILYVDVGVENPIIKKHVINFLKKAENYLKKVIKSNIIILKPKQSYWMSLIGKGYPIPRPWFRWCQNHLKIKPFYYFIKNLDTRSIVFTGQRLNESNDRKRLLISNGIKGNRIHLTKSKIPCYAPLLFWGEIDIWDFLISEKPFWDESYDDVIRLYKEAKGDCPFIPDKIRDLSGCGSRFGCWVCSLVREDKTLLNQSKKNNILKKLLEFRKWLIDYCEEPTNRAGISRKGEKIDKFGKGILRLSAREIILKKLLSLQKEVNFTLIESEEIEKIYHFWEEDLKLFGKIIY